MLVEDPVFSGDACWNVEEIPIYRGYWMLAEDTLAAGRIISGARMAGSSTLPEGQVLHVGICSLLGLRRHVID